MASRVPHCPRRGTGIGAEYLTNRPQIAPGKFRVRLAWEGDNAVIKGIGVSGDVRVMDDHVELVLKLGLAARAAGVDPKRLEKAITRRLAEAFSA